MGHGIVAQPSSALRSSSWERVVDVAEKYYAPGVFTTFAGYEWTGTNNGAILHRVVMFSGGPSETRENVPFTSLDSSDPQDLWRALATF